MANGPSFESKAYTEQLPDVVIVNDCYEGTSAVNAKGQTYLRKFGAETNEDYAARLKSSKFWNAFRRTVHGLTGLIFRRNPVIEKDVPEQLKAIFEDVDLQGTHLDVYAKERCQKGLTDGHTFIYVDMPQSITVENPEASLADERAANLRPYWVAVNKEQVINWRSEKIQNVETLTLLVIKECLMEPEGDFGETEVEQFRVLRPGSWEVWRNEGDEKEEKWVLHSSGPTSLDYIPIAVFYAMQTGFLKSTPPLLDVAHENLRHYNLQSGLDRVLDLCNVPTPVLKGRSKPEEPLVVGATVIDIPTDGDAFFLEPSGVAIAATQEEIDRSKVNIASLGLLLLSSSPQVTKTATETTVEFTAETAELSAIARRFQDCLEQAAKITADYLGLGKDAGGQIKINKEFVNVGLDPQVWQRLQDDVANNRLTLEIYWQILESHEILPDDFDATKERAAADMEKEKGAELGQKLFSNFDRGLDNAGFTS